MNILQLCCFSNHWSTNHNVDSWDLRLNKNIFDITNNYARSFDVIVASPPCDQFTKANALNWQSYPNLYIDIAVKCLELCKQTNNIWWFENPPGRIEKFIPELTKYRLITWRTYNSNKEYVIYGNTMINNIHSPRYSGKTSITNMCKKNREEWLPELIKDFENSL